MEQWVLLVGSVLLFVLLLVPVVVRLVARSWFQEKQRHLREMLAGPEEKLKENEDDELER